MRYQNVKCSCELTKIGRMELMEYDWCWEEHTLLSLFLLSLPLFIQLCFSETIKTLSFSLSSIAFSHLWISFHMNGVSNWLLSSKHIFLLFSMSQWHNKWNSKHGERKNLSHALGFCFGVIFQCDLPEKPTQKMNIRSRWFPHWFIEFFPNDVVQAVPHNMLIANEFIFNRWFGWTLNWW